MSDYWTKEHDIMAEKRMREKNIPELENDFLAYGKNKEWHSLEAVSSYLAIRYLVNEQYEEALEAIVSALAVQLSGCSKADCVCKYDDISVCTYYIGLIRECAVKLSLTQEALEIKVKGLLKAVFDILPFSYYEPETALAIIKDCRNKAFNPKKYVCDHAKPHGKNELEKADNEEKKGCSFLVMKHYTCV